MKLSLGEPPIRGRLHHAYPLSILANHPDFSQWFYTQYIQVAWQNQVIGRNLLELSLFDFYQQPSRGVNCSLLDTREIPMEQLAALEDPLSYVMDHLHQGYAVYLYADDYYIPGRFSYGKMHFVHDLMVYGYEQSVDRFHIVGYNERMIYTKGTVSSQSLREAIRNSTLEEGLKHTPYPEELSLCTLLRTNPEQSCTFQPERLIEQLSDYLNAGHHTERYTIGKQGAVKLGQYLEAVGQLRTLFDVRPFYLIWEHKKHLREAVEFAEKQTGTGSAWSERLAPIEKRMLHNRNLAVKYSISRQQSLLQEMHDNFYEAEDMEAAILEQFLNDHFAGKLGGS
ncbi:hypothetical protein [Paenibacillus xylaniclasticus]|uniref:hypothetical protein n=1 Tax=Paenibacillus xylaniclasticus TaxID=588083 RepID=UPI000FDB2336|nr:MULTISPECIES: hypothetical protein [Paenibacillus]GFN32188.1 hypothetical protein PCURB6_24480 [Paenibacillus curdlanolyticus]